MTSIHLWAFAKHGGRPLIYHGWADQQVAPGSSVEFYKAALKFSASSARDASWIRLFMVPGMGHCTGGQGPDTFDKIRLIERWVEKGEIPARVIASHRSAGKVGRTRPLCPYPKVARHDGTGSIDEAENFTCRLPP